MLARLTQSLSIVLPTPLETSFLRACLWTGEPARRAWASHQERAGDLRRLLATDSRGLKKLAPLLLRAAARSALAVDETLLTVLRTAHLRASLRSRAVRSIARDVLQALGADGVPHVVLDGLALAETAYGDPALRHCAVIELLVRADDLPRASRRLSLLAPIAPGFAEVATDPCVLRHASGLPIVLRSRLVLQRDHSLPTDGLLAATRTTSVAEVPTRILSAGDCLLDVCLRGFFDTGRAGVGWVPDAWHVLHGTAALDWNGVLERSHEGNLDLPLLVTLGYLAERLEAPIPPAVLNRLGDAASRADPITGEKALSVALAAPGAPARLLAMGGGWGPRLTVARWMFIPSRGYLRAHYQLSRAWQTPFYYLYRPLRFLARRLAALGR